MKKAPVFIIMAWCLILQPGGVGADQRDSNTDAYGECEARCGAMTGEAKYRCLRTCITTKKKQAPQSESDANSRFKECEEQCSGSRGLEKVKCIRICLDRKREGASILKEAALQSAMTPCERKCAVLSGSLRDRCVSRCGKNSDPEYRDPLRFKK